MTGLIEIRLNAGQCYITPNRTDEPNYEFRTNWSEK